MDHLLEKQGIGEYLDMSKREIIFTNFTRLSSQELCQIHEWRNLDYIRENMDNSEVFSLDQHLEFCKSLASRKDKLYFQVKVDGDACAVIDFVDIDFEKKSAEGGFYILKEYARNGYSISRCANTLCNSIGLKTIYTHVLKFNQKAVLYNLIKLKGHLLKEDENSVYFSFQMYADNFQKDPFFKDHSCQIIL